VYECQIPAGFFDAVLVLVAAAAHLGAGVGGAGLAGKMLVVELVGVLVEDLVDVLFGAESGGDVSELRVLAIYGYTGW
jgi:hypothetical protein